MMYDVGRYEDYRGNWWHSPISDIDGEINSEFGNCEQVLGWKLVEESEE